MARALALGAVMLMVGCARSAERAPDATTSLTSVHRAVQIAPRALKRLDDAFALEKGTIAVTVPMESRRPVTVAPGKDAWVEISTEGARSVVASQLGEVVLFAGALPQTDVAWLAGRDRVEEIRVLLDASASPIARSRVRVGPGIETIRLRDGRVQLVDATGYVVLATDPMFAVDARGVQRSVDVALEVSGREAIVTAKLDPRGLAYPIALDPVWTVTPAMATARSHHGAVLLPTGKVLVAGGDMVSAAELYDPATNTWSATGAMASTRIDHALVMLPSGKVLAAGGNAVKTNELYDHVTGKWLPAAPHAATHGGFMSWTALKDGRVMVLGGNFDKRAEVYDPTLNDWTFTGAFTGATHGTALATLATTGKVLHVGEGSGSSTVVETWDPATNAWTPLPTPYTAVTRNAIALPSGKVLALAGGATAHLYDPISNTIRKTLGTPTGSRYGAASLVLLGGKVLAAGGGAPADGSTKLATADLFDPATESFFATDSMSRARQFGAATMLANGAVLVTGGLGCGSDGQQPCPVAEIYRSEVGGACTRASECASGFCVDGVCCESACSGQCEACDLSLSKGKCLPVYGSPHGARSSCPGTGSGDACKETRCDGVITTACQYPSSTTRCSSNACKAGVETHESLCNGTGTCGDTPKTCGSYACGTTSCLTACTLDTQCAAGFYCKGGGPSCVPIEGLGKSCTSTASCASGLFCTDGFCCLASACSAGESCGLAGREGTCAKQIGSTCAAASECASGQCADGVCCESACNGQCEACDVPDPTNGRAGKCIPIKGKPHGSRAACDAGGGDVCAAATCDGEARDKCNAKAGSDVVCRAATCADGKRTLLARCDGKGACPPEESGSCDGFACNADNTACRTRCADLGDCVDGFVCKDEKCVPRSARCSEDGLSSIPEGGAPVACAPYKCATDGTCAKACAGSFECAAGFVCDVVTKTCAPPAAPAGDDGGCAMRSRARDGIGAMFAALLAIGLARRRMRA